MLVASAHAFASTRFRSDAILTVCGRGLRPRSVLFHIRYRKYADLALLSPHLAETIYSRALPTYPGWIFRPTIPVRLAGYLNQNGHMPACAPVKQLVGLSDAIVHSSRHYAFGVTGIAFNVQNVRQELNGMSGGPIALTYPTFVGEDSELTYKDDKVIAVNTGRRARTNLVQEMLGVHIRHALEIRTPRLRYLRTVR